MLAPPFIMVILWLPVAIFFFLPVFSGHSGFRIPTPNDILAVPPKFVFSPSLENITRML